MLTVCRGKYPDIKLFHGDLKAYTAQCDVKFDLIIASGVLEFIEDLNLLFHDCATLLSETGSCVFTYEPVIEFHKCQSENKSLTVSDKNSKLYVEDFFTYRRRFLDVDQALKEASMRVDEFSEFVAYNKGGWILYTISSEQAVLLTTGK